MPDQWDCSGKKREPEQFEGGGEKERVAGGYEDAREKDPINVKAPGNKKRVPGGGGWSPARALCYC